MRQSISNRRLAKLLRDKCKYEIWKWRERSKILLVYSRVKILDRENRGNSGWHRRWTRGGWNRAASRDESFRKPPSVNYRAGNYYRVCLGGASRCGRTDGRKRGENVIWGLHLLVYYRWNNGRVMLPSYNHVGNPQGSCGILGPTPRVFAT